MRYRFNKRDVQTPIFDATEYVRFDAVPEEIEEGHSPQFDNSRHIFDATASFTPGHLGTVRVGYGHEQVRRDGRGFADVGENIFRASWDTYSNEYLSIRASFDAGWRRGTGFVEAASGGDDTDIPISGPGGTQPTLRYYDEADRDRTRGFPGVHGHADRQGGRLSCSSPAARTRTCATRRRRWRRARERAVRSA